MDLKEFIGCIGGIYSIPKVEVFVEELLNFCKENSNVEDMSLYEEKFRVFLSKFQQQEFVDLILTYAGEYFIQNGEYEKGIVLLQLVLELPVDSFGDGVILFLRLAEYYFEKGDTKKGKEFLVRLCTETSTNYEDSIAFRGLTEVWKKYKDQIEIKNPQLIVPVSVSECSMKIEEIFKLSDMEELENALMDHLDELSGNGKYLNYLNRWERIFYDVNWLCMEVNSGGFDSYLSYYGNRWTKTRKALETIGATKMVALMEKIESKFPNCKIPKTIVAIQNSILNYDLEFEEEDTYFYENGICELLNQLDAFVLSNKKKFR
jgi:tetratricopeptide (TPR) repeat protein